MADTVTKITAEGRQRLVEELEWREGELDAQIIERIKEARGFGDFSENSELDDAKEEQAQNARRIAEIRSILNTAVVEEGSARGKSVVSIGSSVEVEDEKGSRTSYTIVGTNETNSLEHKISNESPMGAALIGAKKGDKVEYVTPSGKKRSFKVVKVS